MELADAQESGDQTYEIRDLVEDAIDRYFDVLLPAFIDADFRGNGYEMLWRMLEAHDGRALIRSSAPVSPRARAMAAKVRRACPPRISEQLPFENGQVILGRFTLQRARSDRSCAEPRRRDLPARAAPLRRDDPRCAARRDRADDLPRVHPLLRVVPAAPRAAARRPRARHPCPRARARGGSPARSASRTPADRVLGDGRHDRHRRAGRDRVVAA